MPRKPCDTEEGHKKRTLWFPTPCCLYVVLSEIAGMTAPVSGLGSEPTWMARVPNPSSDACSLMVWMLFECAWPLVCAADSLLKIIGDIMRGCVEN